MKAATSALVTSKRGLPAGTREGLMSLEPGSARVRVTGAV